MENKNSEIAEIDDEKLLEKKSKRKEFFKKNYNSNKYKRKWIPFKFLNYADRKRLIDEASFKDHKKQVSFSQKQKDFKGCFKGKGQDDKPPTPHNTSQYLTSNFSGDKNDQIIMIDYSTKYLQSDMDIDIYPQNFDEENICITGGSMKGIINFNFLDSFDKNEIDSDSNNMTLKKSNYKPHSEEMEDVEFYNKPKHFLQSKIYLDKDRESKAKSNGTKTRIPLKMKVSLNESMASKNTNQIQHQDLLLEKLLQNDISYSERMIKKIVLVNALTHEEIESSKELIQFSLEYLYENLHRKDHVAIMSPGLTADLHYSKKEESTKEFLMDVLLDKSFLYQENFKYSTDKLIDSTINLLSKYSFVDNSLGKEKYSIIFLCNLSESNIKLSYMLQERLVNHLNKLSFNNPSLKAFNVSFDTLLFKKTASEISGIPNFNDDRACNLSIITHVNYREKISNILRKYYENNNFSVELISLDLSITLKLPDFKENQNHKRLSEQIIIRFKKPEVIQKTSIDGVYNFTIPLLKADSLNKTSNKKHSFRYEYDLDIIIPQLTNIRDETFLNNGSLSYECFLKIPDNTLISSPKNTVQFKDLIINRSIETLDKTSSNSQLDNNVGSMNHKNKINNCIDFFQESKDFIHYLSANESAESLIRDLNLMISQVGHFKNQIEDDHIA